MPRSMWRYIINRIFISIPLLFLVTVLVFSLIHLIPGDPIDYLFADEILTPEIRAAHEESLGLNKSLPTQYFLWLSRVLRGDLGMSIQMGRPSLDLILERLPATLLLSFSATVIALLIALPAGIIAAVRRRTFYDYFFMGLALLGSALPQFWLGILLILVFSLLLGVLPSSGYASPLTAPLDSLQYLALPSLTLGAGMAALIARMTRAEMLEELGKEYVQTARAKGLPESLVIFKHTLRNALVPIITVIGVQFGRLLGGTVIVEYIFSWPGVGSLVVEAIYSRDYPLVQALILTFALIFLSVNSFVDVLYRYVNPRITLE